MDGRGNDGAMDALLEGLGLVEDLEVVGASHDARAGPAPADTLNPEGCLRRVAPRGPGGARHVLGRKGNARAVARARSVNSEDADGPTARLDASQRPRLQVNTAAANENF